MQKVFRILAGLAGLAMLLAAARWMIDPMAAAAELAMPLLDGYGRNTQIGDMTSFFFATGGLALYGVLKQKRDFVISSIVLIAGAGTFRILAGLLHEAPIMWESVGVEIAMTVIWTAYAWTLDSSS